jgi:hypothetical protein
VITNYVALYMEQYRVEKGTYVLPHTNILIVYCGPGYWQIEGKEADDELVWKALQREWIVTGKTKHS